MLDIAAFTILCSDKLYDMHTSFGIVRIVKYGDCGWDIQLGKGGRRSYRAFLEDQFAKPQPLGEPRKRSGKIK
jgi:hypothetical protein